MRAWGGCHPYGCYGSREYTETCSPHLFAADRISLPRARTDLSTTIITMNGIQFWSIIGLLLSCYALYVEHKAVAAMTIDPSKPYVAACDLSSTVSCSKVFTSKYGRMLSYFGFVEKDSVLDQPNAALGILFYGIALMLPTWKFIPSGVRRVGMFLASFLSCASSAWLGYILVTVLNDICVVCVSTYVCNGCILILSFRDLLCPPSKAAAKVNVD